MPLPWDTRGFATDSEMVFLFNGYDLGRWGKAQRCLHLRREWRCYSAAIRMSFICRVPPAELFDGTMATSREVLFSLEDTAMRAFNPRIPAARLGGDGGVSDGMIDLDLYHFFMPCNREVALWMGVVFEWQCFIARGVHACLGGFWEGGEKGDMGMLGWHCCIFCIQNSWHVLKLSLFAHPFNLYCI